MISAAMRSLGTGNTKHLFYQAEATAPTPRLHIGIADGMGRGNAPALYRPSPTAWAEATIRTGSGSAIADGMGRGKNTLRLYISHRRRHGPTQQHPIGSVSAIADGMGRDNNSPSALYRHSPKACLSKLS